MPTDFIGVYENAFSSSFCKEIIEYFERMSVLGHSYNRKQTDNAPKAAKDDTAIFMHEWQMYQLNGAPRLLQHFNEILWTRIYPDYQSQYPVLNQDFTNINCFYHKIQKTNIGQGYHVWHCESSQRETSTRIMAWTLYLNDVEEGGETEFLHQHRRIKAKEGTFCLFPAGFTHTHRGNPPISNEKYILTGWIEF